MDKAAALQIKLRNSKQKRSESKAMRARQVLAFANGERLAVNSGPRTRREEKQARKVASGRRLARRRLEYQAAKADRLEMLATDGMLWIVLLTPEQGALESLTLRMEVDFLSLVLADREIEGRELVDTDRDEEMGE